MAERLYTRAEARALLPRLRPLVESLRRADAVISDQARRRRLRSAAVQNGGGDAAREITEAAGEAARAAAEIDALGIVVRDPSSGLVDFPAERDGHPVFLCWRLDEDDVAHWHDRDAGFAGRRPLEPD